MKQAWHLIPTKENSNRYLAIFLQGEEYEKFLNGKGKLLINAVEVLIDKEGLILECESE